MVSGFACCLGARAGGGAWCRVGAALGAAREVALGAASGRRSVPRGRWRLVPRGGAGSGTERHPARVAGSSRRGARAGGGAWCRVRVREAAGSDTSARGRSDTSRVGGSVGGVPAREVVVLGTAREVALGAACGCGKRHGATPGAGGRGSSAGCPRGRWCLVPRGGAGSGTKRHPARRHPARRHRAATRGGRAEGRHPAYAASRIPAVTRALKYRLSTGTHSSAEWNWP